LSEKQAEVLGSGQETWNLLRLGTEICFFLNHQNEFKEFFTQEKDLVFCNDVCCVIEAAGQQHDRNECRFFTEASNCLKSALLHKGNKFPPVLLALATSIKMSYENMELLVEKFRYEKYNRDISGSLEGIALLC
jgi:hypothetical protein